MVLQLFVQFQIARQEHIQRGGGFGDEAAALVEDGLFERVAGQTAVAGNGGQLALCARQDRPCALGKCCRQRFGVALPPRATALFRKTRANFKKCYNFLMKKGGFPLTGLL